MKATLVGFDLELYAENMIEKVAKSRDRNRAGDIGWVGPMKPRNSSSSSPSSDELMVFDNSGVVAGEEEMKGPEIPLQQEEEK